MKKDNHKATDELRPEYKRSDFGKLVRGKYAQRIAEETNVVVIEAELTAAFPNDEAVNKALRGLLEVAQASTHRARRSTGGIRKRGADKSD